MYKCVYHITGKGVNALADMLLENKSLVSLDLSDNEIGVCLSVMSLSNRVSLSNCVSNCADDYAGRRITQNITTHPSLTRLNLSQNALSDKTAAYVTGALKVCVCLIECVIVCVCV